MASDGAENEKSYNFHQAQVLQALSTQVAALQTQLELLEAINQNLASNSNEMQFLWTIFLQFGGLVFAILFGVFAVLSYVIGKNGNQLSFDANQNAAESTMNANQLALFALCLSINQTETTQSACSIVLSNTADLTSLAIATFQRSSSQAGSRNRNSGIAIIAGSAVAGVVFVGFMSYASWTVRKVFRQRFRRHTPVRNPVIHVGGI